MPAGFNRFITINFPMAINLNYSWGVAQLAVPPTVNRKVGGSNPPAPAFYKRREA